MGGTRWLEPTWLGYMRLEELAKPGFLLGSMKALPMVQEKMSQGLLSTMSGPWEKNRGFRTVEARWKREGGIV